MGGSFGVVRAALVEVFAGSWIRDRSHLMCAHVCYGLGMEPHPFGCGQSEKTSPKVLRKQLRALHNGLSCIPCQDCGFSAAAIAL